MKQLGGGKKENGGGDRKDAVGEIRERRRRNERTVVETEEVLLVEWETAVEEVRWRKTENSGER